MRRFSFSLIATLFVMGFITTSQASAQHISTRPSSVQSLSFFVGGFNPRSLDSRGTNDVLFQNGDFLTFDIEDFKGATIGAEYLIGLGDLFDAGLGVGFYQRTSPAVYTSFVNANQTEIEQDLKLRIVPITATFRFLPIGHHSVVTPYIGAGVGILSWRYSESGQFVDFSKNNEVFRNAYVGSGTKTGPVVLGGITFPIGNVGIGGEIRYQGGKADLPTPAWAPGTKIDLGGMNYLFVVNVKF